MIDGADVMMTIGGVVLHVVALEAGKMVGEIVVDLERMVVVAAGETVVVPVKMVVAAAGGTVVLLVKIVGVVVVMVHPEMGCGVERETGNVVLLPKMMTGEMIEDSPGTVTEMKVGVVIEAAAAQEMAERVIGVVVVVVVVVVTVKTGIGMIEGHHQAVMVIGVEEVSDFPRPHWRFPKNIS